MVTMFHVSNGLSVGEKLGKDRELRVRLIQEELSELVDALDEEDEVAVADALGDLLYVVVGSAVTWGIPLDRVFYEIHQANLTKVGGPMSTGGKLLKPAHYVPPNIEQALQRSRNTWSHCPRCALPDLEREESLAGDRVYSEFATCSTCGWEESPLGGTPSLKDM